MGGRSVTTCIVNHNGERYLEASVTSALAVAGSNGDRIVVVDDASTDGSVDLVRQRWPSVRLLCLPENVGPAAARSVALREAPSDLVLLLDNDVAIRPGCLESLRQALEEDVEAAVAMPAVAYADRPDVVQYAGAECHFLGLQALREPDVPLTEVPKQTVQVGSVITACCLVDRSRLPDGFGFDDSFFIYLEDHDFGVRVRALGRRVLAVGDAICLHGLGTPGLSIRLLGGYSPRRVFCLIRNRWQFVLKVYALRTLVLLAPILAVYEVAQLVTVLRKGWLREWGRAAAWIFRHPGTLLRKRREVQRTRRVPDRELLVAGPIPFRAELASGRVERLAKRLLDGVAGVHWKLVRPLV